MKLFEIFDVQNPMKTTDDFFNRAKEIEQVYNPEAYKAAQDLKRYYEENEMDSVSFVPVHLKAVSDNVLYSNKPDVPVEASPGYRGLQNVKRRAGHKGEFDKDVTHEDPHANPTLSYDEKSDIFNAKKRLGH